eukprot:1484289-Alexandrium_andersonii.AAC.1
MLAGTPDVATCLGPGKHWRIQRGLLGAPLAGDWGVGRPVPHLERLQERPPWCRAVRTNSVQVVVGRS